MSKPSKLDGLPVSVRFDNATRAEMQEICAVEERTEAQFVRLAVREAIARRKIIVTVSPDFKVDVVTEKS